MKLCITSLKLVNEVDIMKIIFAAAKDKIQTYNIEDPYLKAFIYKYEKLVPWQTISNAEDINLFIKNELFKELYAMIDERQPEKNHYMKDIDLDHEFERNMDQEHVQRAHSLRKIDENLAKEEVLKPINQNKKDAFVSWWEYIMNGNDEYKKHPSFQYMALKPILESSPANKKNGPLGQNALAVATAYGDMGDGMGQVNFIKSYRKALTEIETMEMESSKSNEKDGWLRIPSQSNDPANFEDNIQKLKNLSIPRGWCTGVNMARPYLSGGDFWLFIQGGEARVAIRFSGDKIAEIQGHQNQRPYEYWEEVFQLVDDKGFDKESYHYKELEKAKAINDNFDKDPNYIETFREMFKEDPTVFSMLSKERQSLPELIGIAIEYWENKILEAKGSGNWDSKLAVFNRTPQEVKKKLNREVLDQIFISSVEVFEKNPKYGLELTSRYSDFFRLSDYASRFAKIIENTVAEKLWIAALVSPIVKKEIRPDLIQKAEEDPAYKMIIELETVDVGTQNPEEIIESYMGSDFDKYFYEQDQDALNALKQEVIEDEEENKSRSYYYRTGHELLDDSLYDESLVNHISENTGSYWYDYIAVDPRERYEELENCGGGEGRNDWENHEESRQLYEESWSNYIYENPNKVYELPYGMEDNVFYGFDLEGHEWYIDAWVNFVRNDFSELFSAESHLLDLQGKDSKEYVADFYKKVLVEGNYNLIKEETEKDFDFLFDEDHMKAILENSNFFEKEMEFVKGKLSEEIDSHPEKASEIIGITDEIQRYYDYYTDEEMEDFYRRDKSKNLVDVMVDPFRYVNQKDPSKDDPEFIKAWESTVERWIELLHEKGTIIVGKAPNSIKYHPKFLAELRKLNPKREEPSNYHPHFVEDLRKGKPETPEGEVIACNWYSASKRVKLAQNVELIDQEDILSTIEGFGTQRFTIGFTKRDGSFRVMNAQRKVQRPYQGAPASEYEGPKEYMTLYDLQIASQIAKESISQVDTTELDPRLLRAAYRRVYPHTVEFIKGGGRMLVVKGSSYAIKHGYFEE